MAETLPPPLRALMAGVIDYAGLFPPAALTMPDAAREYLACRGSADRWALGRFVVPAARLAEFGEAARAVGLLPAPAGDPVRLSALAAADLPAGLGAIASFEAEWGAQGARVEAIEARATNPAEAARVAAQIPDAFEGWVEVPLGQPPAPLLAAVLAGGALPKIRTGGTTPELVPSPHQVLEFLVEAARHDTPFKATAGLHHPLRGQYPYTYEADSARGPMFGYLNLLVTDALLRTGLPASEASAVLLETDPAAITVDGTGLTWRDHRLTTDDLERSRQAGMRAFGSCSFREPMQELPFLSPR